uniref:DNA-binding protein HEXBP-like n=1 Tax=Nicotiana tabacum TaxID=4097 RepID=A0A1S3X7Y8_TOBAC
MVHSQERVEREAKRPCRQGGFSGSPSRGQFQYGRGRPFRHAHTTRSGHRGASSGHCSHSYQQGHSSPGLSMPGPSASYPGARGSLQSPAPALGSCYECGEFGHMRRECSRIVGGPAPQRSHSMSSSPAPPPPAQPARGEAHSARGRLRGG